MHFLNPLILQLEVTLRCPLSCPQCYKSNLAGKEMHLSEIEEHLNNAHELNVKQVVLNGGEPLSHPSICSIINSINAHSFQCILYTSGIGLTDEILRSIKQTNSRLCFSLNGSCSEIHDLSRDAFSLTWESLQLCNSKKMQFDVVWVARHDNICDFPNLIALLSYCNIRTLMITSNRVNGQGLLESEMTADDYYVLAAFIKQYSKQIAIRIDTCFSTLSALLGYTKLPFCECAAGNYSYSVTVDGFYRPCTHIDDIEMFDSARLYWKNSHALNKIRENRCTNSTCNSCSLRDKCSPCYAWCKSHNKDYAWNDFCCSMFTNEEDSSV